MRDEHEHVRDHLRRLSLAARHLETDPAASRNFVAHAQELALFFWKHMLKENEVVFPMAERTGGGTAGLFRWDEGRAQTRLEEQRVLVEHLERAAAAWPNESKASS